MFFFCLFFLGGIGDGYVEVPHSPAFDLRENYTLAAWINPEIHEYMRVIDKGTSGKVDGMSFDLVKEKASLHCSETRKLNSLVSTGWNAWIETVCCRYLLQDGEENDSFGKVDFRCSHCFVGDQQAQILRPFGIGFDTHGDVDD